MAKKKRGRLSLWRTIDAAEKYVANYDGDDRADIKTDVLNAFYAGWEFGQTLTAGPQREVKKTMKVTITREMDINDSLWGFSHLLEKMEKSSIKEKENEIIELIREDLIAFLDDAVWTIDFDGNCGAK